MDYVKKLQDIGLKKEEAEVYLACLKLGFAKVSELSKEINIPRTSIYIYIGNLLERGYLKKSKKQGIEYFIPVEPKFLLDDIEEKARGFSSIIPQLEKFLDFPGKKPKVEYFDTVQGLFKLYETMQKIDYKHIPYIIESKETTKSNLEKMGTEYWTKWQKRFLKKGVVTQGIITKDTIPIIKSASDKLKKVALQRPSTIRVIDEKDFPFDISLYLIYPNQVFIVISQENFVLVIENKAVYNSLVTLYKSLYEKAEKFDIKELL